jgi:hypothetical protein
VHDPHATQPGRGHEAAEVRGGAAAEGDDRVGAGEAALAERLPAVGRDRCGLGALPVRQAEREHVVVLDQQVDERLHLLGQLAGIQHGHTLHALAQDLGQAPGQVVADDDVVRRRATHVQDGVVHASSSWISAATSWGLRPSVSTAIVAAAS